MTRGADGKPDTMAGTHSANCLPNEVLSLVLSHLFKSDLKKVRLVCRLWSEMAIPTLYERVYVSPHSKDLEVFNSIASNKHLSEVVKEVVYDASYFNPNLSKSVYLERLVDQTWNLTAELDGGMVVNGPDTNVNIFLRHVRDRYKGHHMQGTAAYDRNIQYYDYRFVNRGYSRIL